MKPLLDTLMISLLSLFNDNKSPKDVKVRNEVVLSFEEVLNLLKTVMNYEYDHDCLGT